MKGKKLKTVRQIAALLFFIPICSVFLDIYGVIPVDAYKKILFFQLVPSLISFFKKYSIGASGFIFVFILTILLGRIYCSVVCPLGIFMDLAGRTPGMKRNKRDYSKPFTYIRYLILILFIISFFTGTLLIINLIDPYSIFGKMSVSLFKPFAVTLNNVLSYMLELEASFLIPPYTIKTFHIFSLSFSLVIGLTIVLMAFYRGRLYCNMICPVGTFLGILSKLSIFRIRINVPECINCGKCEKICKSDCIDIKENFIDYSRCVTCFNCIDICPKGAVDYNLSKKDKIEEKKVKTHTRREFAALFLTLLAFFPKVSKGAKKIVVTIPNKIPVPKKAHPIVPPGGIGVDHFLNNCTGCHLCVSKCPTQVLQPSITEYGLNGLFMPYLDPKTAFCTPNCIDCGKVCPTGAIREFSLKEKKSMQLGEVEFIRENCIVVLQKTECGACSEHCPTKAVFMVTEGKVRVPRVDPKICIGCGACEHVCPAKPNKSIYVKPHRIHKKAEKPVMKGQDEDIRDKGIEEFPF